MFSGAGQKGFFRAAIAKMIAQLVYEFFANDKCSALAREYETH
jgi:hypothetical protein